MVELAILGFAEEDFRYIPSFSRIWETFREEIPIKKLRSVLSKSSAETVLRHQREKLDFLLSKRPEDEKLVGRAKAVNRWLKTLESERFPTKRFRRFLERNQELWRSVRYVKPDGTEAEYYRSHIKWSDEQEALLKANIREEPRKLMKLFNKEAKKEKWFPRTLSSLSTKLYRLRKRGVE